MASITIQHGHKNLLFAASVASETGATFDEDGQWITISDSPELVIPNYCFRQSFDHDGRSTLHAALEDGWRSLILNKSGYLIDFNDFEIIIADQKPGGDKRPQFLLRFPDSETKERAEEWSERAGFSSLTEFIISAIASACDAWQEKAGK